MVKRKERLVDNFKRSLDKVIETRAVSGQIVVEALYWEPYTVVITINHKDFTIAQASENGEFIFPDPEQIDILQMSPQEIARVPTRTARG